MEVGAKGFKALDICFCLLLRVAITQHLAELTLLQVALLS